jgi:hypothetical protein
MAESEDMTNSPRGSVTGISNKADVSGDYVIEIAMPDGSITFAKVSLGAARALVSVLQPAILEEAEEIAKTMEFPALDVRGVSIVHHGVTAEVLVDILPIGHAVLVMSDEWLQEVQQVLDRVQTSRKNSKTMQ